MVQASQLAFSGHQLSVAGHAQTTVESPLQINQIFAKSPLPNTDSSKTAPNIQRIRDPWRRPQTTQINGLLSHPLLPSNSNHLERPQNFPTIPSFTNSILCSSSGYDSNSYPHQLFLGYQSKSKCTHRHGTTQGQQGLLERQNSPQLQRQYNCQIATSVHHRSQPHHCHAVSKCAGH